MEMYGLTDSIGAWIVRSYWRLPEEPAIFKNTIEQQAGNAGALCWGSKTSQVSWKCCGGIVRALEHKGNKGGP